MAQETWNARQVAGEASKMLGRTVSPKQVRGLARGDNGAPALPRLADDGYTAHVYSAKERTTLLAAFAARERKRTGRDIKVPSTSGRTTGKAATVARKAATVRKAVTGSGDPDAAPSA